MEEEIITAEDITILEDDPTRWWDLLLYLLVGLGLFFASGMVIAYFYQEIDFTVMALAIITNVLILGGTAVGLGVLRKRISWQGLGLFPPVWRKVYWLLAPVLAFGMMPIRGLFGALVQWVVEGNMESLQMRNDFFMSAGLSWGGFAVMFLGGGVLAPVAEELYFRGLLYSWFKKYTGVAGGVLLSSVFFGLGHFDSMAVLVSSFIMGLVMAYAYERTKTLWVPIVIHVVTNSTSVVMLYLLMVATELLDISL